MNNANSLKEAINVTLSRLNYNKNDKDIIRKLINKALNGETIYFSNTYGARDYVVEKTKEEILKELVSTTKCTSNNIEDVINEYIDKCFKETEKIELDYVNESDLDKISKKMRYLSTISANDEEFNSKVWNFFTNAFVGKDESVSIKEIRDDMIYSALNVSKLYYSDNSRIKSVDKNSKNMTEMDAVILTMDYVCNEDMEELYKIINTNQIFSGLLLQNLLDYTYSKKELIRQFKEEHKNKSICNNIDKKLEYIDDIKEKGNILSKILKGGKVKNVNLSYETVLTGVLINALNLFVYTNNRKSVDYDETKLYVADSLDYDDEVINNRKLTNNKLAGAILEGNFTNFNDKELYFLANMYVISRSLKDNKNKIDNAIYFGTDEQINIYKLMIEPDFYINQSKKKVA